MEITHLVFFTFFLTTECENHNRNLLCIAHPIVSWGELVIPSYSVQHFFSVALDHCKLNCIISNFLLFYKGSATRNKLHSFKWLCACLFFKNEGECLVL